MRLNEYTGLPLDPVLVQRAIDEKRETEDKHGGYMKVPVGGSSRVIGKAPVEVRWVIRKKGDQERPDYRARLVAKEIKCDHRLDLFAAMPPLEAKKFPFSLAMSNRAKSGKPYKLQSIDAERAYFHALCVRDVYV